MRGLPLWIYLTEGKSGGLFRGGVLPGFVCLCTESAAAAVPVTRGAKEGMKTTSRISGWIARELPRWSLKSLFFFLRHRWGS